MKKYLVVLIALLFATGAFAQEAEKKGPDFNYSFYGLAYGAMGSQDDYSYDYSHIRVRPMLSVGNENVKGVVRFEIDQDFGLQATDAGADNGTDNKVVEVKWAFIQVKDMLIPNLTFTAGLNGYVIPLVADNDFAMYAASYDFGMGKVELAYLKHQEYGFVSKAADGTKSVDDIETYAIQIPVKAGAVSIKPAYAYTKVGKDINSAQWETDAAGALPGAAEWDEENVMHDGNISNYGITANGDFGVVTLDLAFDYSKGKVKYTSEDDGTVGQYSTFKTDIKTYAFDAELAFKVNEAVKLGVFYTLYSGDDKDDDEYCSHNDFMDGVYGAPDGRLFLLDNGGTATLGGHNPFDKGNAELGLVIYGLYADAAFGKFSAFAQYAYVTSAKDNAAGDSLVGQEIDLKAAYEVAPKTSLFVEYSYIVAGDDGMGLDVAGKAEDVQQVLWGLSTSI
jgi:hypothetical protein